MFMMIREMAFRRHTETDGACTVVESTIVKQYYSKSNKSRLKFSLRSLVRDIVVNIVVA